jgi:hypothetical protein
MSLPPPFVLKSDKPVLAEDETRILFVKPIKDMDGAVAYFKAKMLVGDQIRTAKDGIYSWLLKEGGLAMIPVESEQEIGSVHANLWSWTPTLGRVLAGGELEKHGTNIDYNLHSGSFMRLVMKKQEDQTRLTRLVNGKLRELEFWPVFLKCKPEGHADCDEAVERLSGKKIVDNATIVTPESELFWYRQFFTAQRTNAPVTPRTMAQFANALNNQTAGKRSKRNRRYIRNKRRTRRR